MSVEFYIGLDDLPMARHFERCCISVNRLRRRVSDFPVNRWMMDSGAFTEISTYGDYREGVRPYADMIRRWSRVGILEIAVAQDFMCEPWIVKKTGLSVPEHQRRTIERYDALVAEALPVPIMPVIQGFDPADYLRHLDQYGNRLETGMRVGVGSICKRNGSPFEITNVLARINSARPDLRLHGFGIKKTSLLDPGVRSLLATADSMAWSYHARKNKRSAHSVEEAARWLKAVDIAAAKPGGWWQPGLAL